ncbi:MAG: geranylgeranyl reductase family protein, partial [Candidatus Diapherotrites archaeon]|nr:geranylgeranyl reductase family protein [Candidatus Diapherotrites archaeon]
MNSVAVVGAGPAGLSVAINTQKAGWNTIVIEEHSEVGIPINCTGIISRSGVEELGLDIGDITVNAVRGARIFSPSKEELLVQRSENVAYIVERDKLDKKLAAEAEKAGVKIKTSTTLLDYRNKTLFVKSSEHGEILKAEILVGADGPYSKTRSIMGTNVPKEKFVHAYQFRVKGNYDKHFVEVHLGDFAKGYFAWVVPENEEMARVGLAVSSGRNVRESFESFMQKTGGQGERCDMCSKLIPTGEPLKEIVKGNILLVGDAAFQTKATSIDYEEPIVILDENGYIKNEKIGVLAANELTNPVNEIILSKDNEIAIPQKDILAFSPTQKAETNGFRMVKTILRHEIDEDLYEIILEKGYRVKATASHSIMVATKDGFEAKHTKKLQAGKDIIALNAKIPMGKIIEEINLTKEFMRHCPELIKKISIKGARERIYKKPSEVDNAKRTQYWYHNIIPLSVFVDKGIIPAQAIISMANSRLSYKDTLTISPQLCRLLGYFAAEGSYKNNNLTVTFGIKDVERGYVKDALECIRFGLEVEPEKLIVKKHPHTKKPSAVSITFGGTIAKNLLMNVLRCGNKARGKQVPWIIFNVKDEMKKEFLKGYLRGDGTIRIREPKDTRHSAIEISVKTISRKMASDIVLLSFQLGMFPSIEDFKERKNHSILGKKVICKNGYKISYSKAQDILMLKDVFYSTEKKITEFFADRISRSTNNLPKELLDMGVNQFSKELVTEFGSSIYSNYKNLPTQRVKMVLQKSGNRHEFLKNIASQGMILLKVREIKKVIPTEKFVYDVEIPETQMFCGGIGPILLHNTGGGILSGIKAGRACAKTIDEFYKNKKPLTDYAGYVSGLNKELHLHWKIR